MNERKPDTYAPAARARRFSRVRVAIANALLLLGWLATALVPETLPRVGVGAATVAAVGAAIVLPIRGAPASQVERNGSRLSTLFARPPTGARVRPPRNGGGTTAPWRRA
jgi:hypothetical protein